jgi:hypothetical protein
LRSLPSSPPRQSVSYVCARQVQAICRVTPCPPNQFPGAEPGPVATAPFSRTWHHPRGHGEPGRAEAGEKLVAGSRRRSAVFSISRLRNPAIPASITLKPP